MPHHVGGPEKWYKLPFEVARGNYPRRNKLGIPVPQSYAPFSEIDPDYDYEASKLDPADILTAIYGAADEYAFGALPGDPMGQLAEDDAGLVPLAFAAGSFAPGPNWIKWLARGAKGIGKGIGSLFGKGTPDPNALTPRELEMLADPQAMEDYTEGLREAQNLAYGDPLADEIDALPPTPKLLGPGEQPRGLLGPGDAPLRGEVGTHPQKTFYAPGEVPPMTFRETGRGAFAILPDGEIRPWRYFYELTHEQRVERLKRSIARKDPEELNYMFGYREATDAIEEIYPGFRDAYTDYLQTVENIDIAGGGFNQMEPGDFLLELLNRHDAGPTPRPGPPPSMRIGPGEQPKGLLGPGPLYPEATPDEQALMKQLLREQANDPATYMMPPGQLSALMDEAAAGRLDRDTIEGLLHDGMIDADDANALMQQIPGAPKTYDSIGDVNEAFFDGELTREQWRAEHRKRNLQPDEEWANQVEGRYDFGPMVDGFYDEMRRTERGKAADAFQGPLRNLANSMGNLAKQKDFVTKMLKEHIEDLNTGPYTDAQRQSMIGGLERDIDWARGRGLLTEKEHRDFLDSIGGTGDQGLSDDTIKQVRDQIARGHMTEGHIRNLFEDGMINARTRDDYMEVLRNAQNAPVDDFGAMANTHMDEIKQALKDSFSASELNDELNDIVDGIESNYHRGYLRQGGYEKAMEELKKARKESLERANREFRDGEITRAEYEALIIDAGPDISGETIAEGLIADLRASFKAEALGQDMSEPINDVMEMAKNLAETGDLPPEQVAKINGLFDGTELGLQHGPLGGQLMEAPHDFLTVRPSQKPVEVYDRYSDQIDEMLDAGMEPSAIGDLIGGGGEVGVEAWGVQALVAGSQPTKGLYHAGHIANISYGKAIARDLVSRGDAREFQQNLASVWNDSGGARYQENLRRTLVRSIIEEFLAHRSGDGLAKHAIMEMIANPQIGEIVAKEFFPSLGAGAIDGLSQGSEKTRKLIEYADHLMETEDTDAIDAFLDLLSKSRDPNVRFDIPL